MKHRFVASALTALLLTSFGQAAVHAAVSYTGVAETKIVLYKKAEASSSNQWIYLVEGARFEVVAQTKQFYSVVTRSGKRGYVKKEGVKLVSKQETSETAAGAVVTPKASVSEAQVVDLDEGSSTVTNSATTNVISTDAKTSSDREYANDMLTLVNSERAKGGLGALSFDDTMQKAADIRVLELVKSFSNIRPDGSSFGTVFQESGYSRSQKMAENIAYAYDTPTEAMREWMNSDGHRGNIMNQEFKYFAVSKTIASNGNVYWVQLFG